MFVCMLQLPPRVRTCREKELQQFRRQIAGLPLSLGGASFNSVDHLNKCMHDLLDKTEAGKTLKKDSVAEKAVLALLDFHPNAFIKKGGHDRHPIGIKVDLHAKTNKDGSPSKCFFVIRQHKESKEEDAEVNKHNLLLLVFYLGGWCIYIYIYIYIYLYIYIYIYIIYVCM